MELISVKGLEFFLGAVAGGYHKFIGLIEVTELPWGSASLECVHGILNVL